MGVKHTVRVTHSVAFDTFNNFVPGVLSEDTLEQIGRKDFESIIDAALDDSFINVLIVDEDEMADGIRLGGSTPEAYDSHGTELFHSFEHEISKHGSARIRVLAVKALNRLAQDIYG